MYLASVHVGNTLFCHKSEHFHEKDRFGVHYMHGLIFVTWEKYLSERFKGTVLKKYRDALGQTSADAPLTSRVYDDEVLLAGVTAVSRITGISVDTLLREYGRYFLVNGLTRHLCAHLLMKVHSGRDLLLTMHDAHEQMTRLPDGLTPPLFQYRTQSGKPDALTLIYDSPRKLCSVLTGAIEGAAERYGEHAHIVEQTCMKRGDPVCRFEVRFSASSKAPMETAEQMKRYQTKQQFAQFLLSLLPEDGGVTLAELQELLIFRKVGQEWRRPALLLQALQHLHHAGLVATTANQPGDNLALRRYWRAPTEDTPLRNTAEAEKTEHVPLQRLPRLVTVDEDEDEDTHKWNAELAS